MRLRARGFTLMESLVALVVLSVGMLGALAMLVGSLRTHADARRRAAGVSLMRDIADLLRIDPRADLDALSAAGARIRHEPATGPTTPERFEIALDVGRAPSEADVMLLTVLVQPPVAGGA